MKLEKILLKIKEAQKKIDKNLEKILDKVFNTEEKREEELPIINIDEDKK